MTNDALEVKFDYFYSPHNSQFPLLLVQIQQKILLHIYYHHSRHRINYLRI